MSTSVLSISLLVSAILPAVVTSCGFTVHMLVTHRAFSALASTPRRPFFMSDLAENPGSLYAGSPYPDYLYACGSNHDNGEYTHWSPFQAVASRYINRTYPAPRNATGRALVAFLAGITSHYMADESWHGINTPAGQGLLLTIGGLDFNATGGLDQAAHTFGDDTGEFVSAYETFLNWDDPTQWIIPIPDLLNIYSDAKRTDVLASDIEECAAIFFAGAEAVKAAAALAEPILASQSPTFGESLFDMPVGGIDDMAVMAGRMWQRLGEWIDGSGPPSGDIHDLTLPPSSRPWVAAEQRLLRALAGPVRAAGLIIESRAADGRFKLSLAPDATPERFAAVAASAIKTLIRGEPLPRQKVGATSGWTVHADEDDDVNDVAARYATALLSRHAGSSIRNSPVDIAAALDALSVSSSLSRVMNAINAINRDEAEGPMPLPATPVFAAASTSSLEYVGEAIVEGNFGAGESQLIATAYGASPVGVFVDDVPQRPAIRGNGSGVLSQAGGYYTRFSGDGVSLKLKNSENAKNTPNDVASTVGPTPLTPESLTTSASVYSRLGQSACVLDFNGDNVDDLVLGAPTAGWTWAESPEDEWPQYWYLGRVEIFYGVAGEGLPSPIALPSAVITPLTNLSYFGSTLSCKEDVSGDGRSDLIIGSSFYQNYDPSRSGDTDVHGAGRVDIFFSASSWAQSGSTSSPARVTINDANWTLIGREKFQWTGHAVAALANVSLALGLSQEDLVRASLGAHIGESTDIALARAPSSCLPLAAAALSDEGASVALLLVGAPGYRAESQAFGWQVAGRLSGFLLPSVTSAAGKLRECVRNQPTPFFTITADRFDLAQAPMKSTKLGAAVALGFPLGRSTGAPHFAVGMPCVDLCGSSALVGNNTSSVFNTSAGAVAVIPLSSALRGDFDWTSATTSSSVLKPQAVLASRMPDARFGWRLEFDNVLPGKSELADDLFIAAPQYSRFYFGGSTRSAASSFSSVPNPAPTPAGDTGREVGALLVYRGGASVFPSGSFCAAETLASWWAEGPVTFGRMGISWTMFDWDGDGEKELVVGAPRATLPISPQVRGEGPTEYAGLLLAFNFSSIF